MAAKLKTALVGAGATVVAAVTILGGATPAFAKSSETLLGPHLVQVRQAFRLAVVVGDDGGAKPSSSRLQILAADGGYQSMGAWHELRIPSKQNPNDEETYTFTVTETRPGTYTFRAVFSANYPATSPFTVTVR
jgi:hypothetical protein